MPTQPTLRRTAADWTLEARLVPAQVYLAGDTDAAQFDHQGRLAQLVWNGGALQLWTTSEGRQTVETVETDRAPAGLRPAAQAQLVFTPDGGTHVFTVDGGDQVQHYARAAGGAWSLAETLVPPMGDGAKITQLVARLGTGGDIHLALTEYQTASEGGSLRYLHQGRSGWEVEIVRSLGSDDLMGAGREFARRELDMAIDGNNQAHIVVSPDYVADARPGGGATLFSALEYLTNRGGSWQGRPVAEFADGTGDSGMGVSVAIDPQGRVAIAALSIERRDTGSPVSASLMLYTLLADGTVQAETVASRSDGYAGADGSGFTGNAPDLKFDAAGRAVIAFSDLAVWHETYVQERAGQVRLAVRDGAGWRLTTLVRQSNPRTQQVVAPTLALQGERAVVAYQTVEGGAVAVGSVDFGTAPAPAAPAPVPVTLDPVAAAEPATDAADAAVVAGSDAGGAALAVGFAPGGAARPGVAPFGDGFDGGTRVARGDFDGDGVRDLALAAGPGGAPRVVVLNGKTGETLFDYLAFEASFRGGVYLASGDLNADGRADLVVTPDRSGGPRVRVLSGANPERGLADFFGIDDPGFRGGARAAVGDLNADGRGDLAVGAGHGGGPRVALFDGATLRSAGAPDRLAGDFFAYESALRNGVNLAAGDLSGDGAAELAVGAGPGGAPRVRVLDGRVLSTDGRAEDVADFFAGDTGARGGVRVAIVDATADGAADLVTGAGAGDGSRVRAYDRSSVAAGSAAVAWEVDAFPGSKNGVFVS